MTGSVASITGKFSQADTITKSAYLSAAHNSFTQNLGNSTMTVEAYIKLSSSLVANALPTTIASKSASANNFGWKFQMKKASTKNYLVFNASANGTTWIGSSDIRSSSVNLSTSSFTHVAVTFDKGSVTFYVGGVQKGTGTIGVAGSTAIYPSTARLYIGSFAGSYNGLMAIDEFRMSQVLRYTTTFTPPAGAFVAD